MSAGNVVRDDAWQRAEAFARQRGRAGSILLSRAQDELVNNGDLAGAERLLAARLPGLAEDDAHVARLELARILFWRGRPDESRDLLERLHEERPGDTWTLSFLGQVTARFGDYEKARSLFEEALSLDGSNHEARLFLGGDDLGDALRARRMLTHGTLSPRGRIELGAVCAALDVRRGRRPALAHGELTQAFLDRANLMMDCAGVGDDVDAAASLRPAFVEAERILFYTSHALGDALLGMSAIDALGKLFDLHPHLRRPVTIISPYAAVLAGIAERHPFATVRSLCGPRDPAEAAVYAEDLRRHNERTVVLVSSAPAVSTELLAAAQDRGRALAVVDLLIDRYSRDIVPWQSVVPPRRHITSYPAKLHRLIEILLGCKLTDRPAEVCMSLPLGTAVERRRELLLHRYKLDGTVYHCVIESASKSSKAFAPDLLSRFLCEIARECAAAERESRQAQRIVFSCDTNREGSFAPEIARLPDDVRARIEPIHEDLPGMVAILSTAATVVSTDTGLAHLSSALGRQTLIVYTVADPCLWTTGGANVRALWSPQAMNAHLNLTPVNMQEWETPHPIMAESLSVRDLVDGWRRCREAAAARREHVDRRRPAAQARVSAG